jgi:hypothetical protein
MDRFHPSTGACRLVGEDARERRPPRILSGFGEMVMIDHVADPQILVVVRIVGSDQRQSRLLVEVPFSAAHLLVRPGRRYDGFAPSVTALLAA